jgi:hypothetical protein
MIKEMCDIYLIRLTHLRRKEKEEEEEGGGTDEEEQDKGIQKDM